MQTFRDVGEEVLFFRRQQITKYTHVYSISLQLLNATQPGLVQNVEPILQIMEDADFHITHMTGSVTDPTDSIGKRYITTGGSALGLLFPLAGSPNRGERGIWFKFENPKVNRPLQMGLPNLDAVTRAAQYLVPYNNTLIPFESVFSPGYGNSWGKPIKFDYALMRNERLKITLQNRAFGIAEAAPPLYTRVSMAFIGHRYES